MSNFLQDSLRELDHVVWPTKAETRQYFLIVTVLIAISTLVLFLSGSAITNALFGIRAVVTPPAPMVAPSDIPPQNVDDLLKNLDVKAVPSTNK